MQRVIPYFIILLLLIACAPVVKNPSQLPRQTQLPSEKEYRIQVGDQLDIKFFYNPELNEQVIVRPDGRISLQLVREIVAAGLTPSAPLN